MSPNRRRLGLRFAALAIGLVLAGCAHHVPEAVSAEAPGFWLGLVQGIFAPFAFIASFFDRSIAIYSVPNDGGWYDFGFLCGIGAWGGGGAAASR